MVALSVEELAIHHLYSLINWLPYLNVTWKISLGGVTSEQEGNLKYYSKENVKI